MKTSSTAKQATIYESSDGTQHLVAADAQQHQLRLNVRDFINTRGIGQGGEWDARMIEDDLVDGANDLLTAIRDAAAITPEA